MSVSSATFAASVKAVFAAAVAVALPMAPLASAQSSAASVVEEVTVTARRRSESLQDVPIAVSAISGDELTRRGAQDLTEIAQAVPSVTLEPSRATNSTTDKE